MLDKSKTYHCPDVLLNRCSFFHKDKGLKMYHISFAMVFALVLRVVASRSYLHLPKPSNHVGPIFTPS
jgi:hypothetical protein